MRWVPCCFILAWCLGGTGCGVMRVWSPGEMHVQRPGWGVAICGSCSVVGLRWWADAYRACVPSVICVLVSVLVSDCLCMPDHYVSLRHEGWLQAVHWSIRGGRRMPELPGLECLHTSIILQDCGASREQERWKSSTCQSKTTNNVPTFREAHSQTVAT